jgi:hypothetical protein
LDISNVYAKAEATGNLTRAKSGRISFLDVLSAVPPFPSYAREAKPVERRDRSQSSICAVILRFFTLLSTVELSNDFNVLASVKNSAFYAIFTVTFSQQFEKFRSAKNVSST